MLNTFKNLIVTSDVRMHSGKIKFIQRSSVVEFCFKNLLFLSLIFFLNEKTVAQSPGWLWAKSIGGDHYDGDHCNSIAIDASGNFYTTGYFNDTVDFDPGPGTYNMISGGGGDIFVLKLDSSGNFIWAKQMGGIAGIVFGYGKGLSIAIDAFNNIYTTGKYTLTIDFDPGPGTYYLSNGRGFISKLDSSGNFVWAKDSEPGNSIVVDDSSNFYTTGETGQYGAFISKSDSAGNLVWSKTMGGTTSSGICTGFSIALDASGNVYTTGGFEGAIDFDPGIGTDSLKEIGGGDIFISKLDASGNFVWAKQMGGTQGGSSSSESGHSIAVDASGNVYTTGNFGGDAGDISDFDPGPGTYYLSTAGSADIFISKLDASGNFVWAKRMGNGAGDVGYSIALDLSGNIYTAGIFYGTVDFDPGIGTFNLPWEGMYDIFISKLDGNGNFFWAKAIGGDREDLGSSLALDASSNIYVTGSFESHFMTVDSINLTNADTVNHSSDILIAKIRPLATGINSIMNNYSISVYPNPANETLVISYPLLGNKKDFITISDILGKIIYSNRITENQNTVPIVIEVNTSNFTEGIYLVQIKSEKFIETKKIILVH